MLLLGAFQYATGPDTGLSSLPFCSPSRPLYPVSNPCQRRGITVLRALSFRFCEPAVDQTRRRCTDVIRPSPFGASETTCRWKLETSIKLRWFLHDPCVSSCRLLLLLLLLLRTLHVPQAEQRNGNHISTEPAAVALDIWALSSLRAAGCGSACRVSVCPCFDRVKDSLLANQICRSALPTSAYV
ncbi:hypothetical protein LZ30DRAFT_311585 [Colletotrichum cereale]|nr:hypothetical protein LZ30DRAFT_311585 [Colletotrichum cereale]